MPSNTSNRTTTKKFLSPLRSAFRKRPEVIEAINNLLEVIDNPSGVVEVEKSVVHPDDPAFVSSSHPYGDLYKYHSMTMQRDQG